VDGAQVGVLEESDEIGLASLLQSSHCRALEPQIGLVLLGDLADEALEGQLADEQLSALLVLADLAESDCAGAEAMGLLDAATGSGLVRRLARGLAGDLLLGGLASSGLACGLLGACHF